MLLVWAQLASVLLASPQGRLSFPSLAEADLGGPLGDAGAEADLPEAAFRASSVLEPRAGRLSTLGALPSHWADPLHLARLLLS